MDARLACSTRSRGRRRPPPAEVSASTAPSAADGGSPSTAASVNTNAALRALLKQKDAQIAALTAQLVGPKPRRPPPGAADDAAEDAVGNVSIARQSPRKRHGALLGQIRDIL